MIKELEISEMGKVYITRKVVLFNDIMVRREFHGLPTTPNSGRMGDVRESLQVKTSLFS